MTNYYIEENLEVVKNNWIRAIEIYCQEKECRLIKMQRNEYERKLLFANRQINKLEAENKYMEDYINLHTSHKNKHNG